MSVSLSSHWCVISTFKVPSGGLAANSSASAMHSRGNPCEIIWSIGQRCSTPAPCAASTKTRLVLARKSQGEIAQLAGCDPTGTGQTLAGVGDQREVELLVEGGFTPVEAIHIATQNGATFLGVADRIGSVAAGKQADLVLLDGDLAKDITVIENPEIVFKRGVGYDSNAIYESLHGQVGLQ